MNDYDREARQAREAQEKKNAVMKAEAERIRQISSVLSRMVLPRDERLLESQSEIVLDASKERPRALVVGPYALMGFVDHNLKQIVSFAPGDLPLVDKKPAAHFDRLYQPFARAHGYLFLHLMGETHHAGMREPVIEFIVNKHLVVPMIHIIEGKFNPVAGRLQSDFSGATNPLDTGARLERSVYWPGARTLVEEKEIDEILEGFPSVEQK